MYERLIKVVPMTLMAVGGLIALFILMVFLSWQQAANDEFADCQIDESHLSVPDPEVNSDDILLG